MHRQRVFCEVEPNISDYTGCYHYSCLKRPVAGLLTSEIWVRTQVSPCEIPCAHSDNVTGVSPRSSVRPGSTIPPLLHTHPHLHVAYRPGTLQSNAISEIRGHRIEQYFHQSVNAVQ